MHCTECRLVMTVTVHLLDGIRSVVLFWTKDHNTVVFVIVATTDNVSVLSCLWVVLAKSIVSVIHPLDSGKRR